MNAEGDPILVQIHVGASVIGYTPFFSLFQTVDIIIGTPEVDAIFERLVDFIFHRVFIFVHVTHSSVDASVGKHNVIFTKGRVVAASSATVAMERVNHSAVVATQVSDSAILISFNDVEIRISGQVVITPSTGLA